MMGRKAGKRKPPIEQVTGIDATPERMAMEPDSEIVPVAAEGFGRRQGKARKFKASQLDRWHRAGILSYHQWLAGDIYRETHARCQFALRVVASYGERTAAGEHPGVFGYGLPPHAAQLDARARMRKMREQWPQAIQGYMDRLLIHDTLPRYGGRRHQHAVADVRKALDTMAEYLRLTG